MWATKNPSHGNDDNKNSYNRNFNRSREWYASFMGKIGRTCCVLGAFVVLLVACGFSSVYQHSRLLASSIAHENSEGGETASHFRFRNPVDRTRHSTAETITDSRSSSSSSSRKHNGINSNTTLNESSKTHRYNTTNGNINSGVSASGAKHHEPNKNITSLNTAESAIEKWESILSENNGSVSMTTSVLDVPIEFYATANNNNNNNNGTGLLKLYVYDLEELLPPSYASDVFDWYVHERPESHWVTDLALERLFRTYPGRVSDPSEADLFVVPYPHAGHCMRTPGYALGCRQLDAGTTESTVLANLEHHNETTRDRHLFVLSDSEMVGQSWLAHRPLLATYGPIWEHRPSRRKTKKYKRRNGRSPRGHIVIPPFSPGVGFQPAFLERQRVQEQQQHHQQQQQQQQQRQPENAGTRDLSLVFVASDTNPRMPKSPRAFRRYLLKELDRIGNEQRKEHEQQQQRLFRDTNSSAAAAAVRILSSSVGSNAIDATSTSTSKSIDAVPDTTNRTGSIPASTTTTTFAPELGGLPFVASSDVGDFPPEDLYALYRRSVFCPVLAGDITWQRRFFDAIACGCLPVVVSYPLTSRPFRNHRKHYRKENGDAGQSGGGGSSRNQPREVLQKQSPVSWFVPEDGPHSGGDTWSVQESYPFVDQIDYRSFVVECEGNSTHPETTAKTIVSTLVGLLEETPSAERGGGTTILEAKQAALRAASTSLVYGVGPDAHRTNDAFAHLIRSLRHYVDELEERQPGPDR